MSSRQTLRRGVKRRESQVEDEEARARREYYDYHSDSEPELDADELEADRRVFNSVTEEERQKARELTRRMVLICEQHAENGPKMLKQILCALGPLIPGLPKDPRTALEESIGPWSNESIEMQGGVYWHRGFENGIRANRATDQKDLTFDIQVDEVSLEQMTKPTFLAWIIMARLHEGSKPPGEPFVVGVFCGDAEPHCEEFLGPFIEEAERLCEAPLTINGDSVTVKPRVVITDVAARAFVKGTVHQSNYYGCPKCTIKGKFVSGSTITFFGKRNTNPRTNEEFRRGVYAGTHQLVRDERDGQPFMTPLARLPIDLVQNVIVGENRRLLHIGAMKTLFFAFADGLGNIQAMERQHRELMETTLHGFRYPHERKQPNYVTDIAKWPHTMWGCFLDIVGVVILKPAIKEQYYDNYCRLHWAVAICNNRRYRHLLNYARLLIEDFVKEHQKLVGYVTSTFHCLLHLVDEVEMFGALPLQSAYPFKAAHSNLKHRVDVTKRTPPEQQIARALLLREAARRGEKPLPLIPIPTNDDLRVVIREKFVLRCESISADDKNSWFLAPNSASGGQVVKFLKASADPFTVYGQPLAEQTTSYKHPVNVPDGLNVFTSIDKTQLQNTKEYRLKDMICKLCPLNMQSYTAFVPLPESFAET
ncbi:uncharacterized protein LOC128267214 [Anopheles cruzii]|uniref:uncharacterized protein LOC128267214 n=1 Tax=Anopheles cruzii TaxID=68878 RepID=UPI0022EC210C|nr:uncharacterized protein LOC128267214 [Anopheles cruzii]XP_052859971.1 uncharacterized protein LOC128267214 [Anopheles cruzii]XP_052859972.1 uncharacterized protein LOC128267214 [Anopheles cruzii]XP_052859973.1 uncharacterized protein LOC128267214 [Anopheles cruzii]